MKTMFLNKDQVEEVFKKDILIATSLGYKFVFNIFSSEYKILKDSSEISGGQAIEELIEEYDELVGDKNSISMAQVDEVLNSTIILSTDHAGPKSKSLSYIVKSDSFKIFKDKELVSELRDLDTALDEYNNL